MNAGWVASWTALLPGLSRGFGNPVTGRQISGVARRQRICVDGLASRRGRCDAGLNPGRYAARGGGTEGSGEYPARAGANVGHEKSCSGGVSNAAWRG
jgi:hypothetical protein